MLKFTVSISNTIRYDVLAPSSHAALLKAFEDYPEEFAIRVELTKLPDPCPLTGRRVVTVGEWLARPEILREAAAYYYDPEADKPFLIAFFDAHIDGRFVDLALGFQRNITVSPKHEIYTSAASWGLMK